MTEPDENQPVEDPSEAAGEAGALAAASEEDDGSGDPLGPLNRVTEDDEN